MQSQVQVESCPLSFKLPKQPEKNVQFHLPLTRMYLEPCRKTHQIVSEFIFNLHSFENKIRKVVIFCLSQTQIKSVKSIKSLFSLATLKIRTKVAIDMRLSNNTDGLG